MAVQTPGHVTPLPLYDTTPSSGGVVGRAAMGFRPGQGTLHVAQALVDAMALQQQAGQHLWLASFDIAKCYDSMAWWAAMGLLEEAGLPQRKSRPLRSFYASLQRRFQCVWTPPMGWRKAARPPRTC